MPHLDGKGPYKSGVKNGREIGYCKDNLIGLEEKIGKGLGLRKHSPFPGKGLGKRYKYNLSND